MMFRANTFRDFRFTLRTLGRSPSFTAVVVITLSIGIGFTTAMFSVISGILLRPLPYPESDRLMAVKHRSPGLSLERAGLSSGIYFHYLANARSFEGLAVYTERVLNLAEDGRGTERVQVTLAGQELFQILAVTPNLGRLFTREDGLPGFLNTTWVIPVLLSYDFWQSRYGGRADVIGRLIKLNERQRRVVGVLPRGFVFPRMETQIWILNEPPLKAARFADSLGYNAIARLRRGLTPAAAAEELASILPRIEGAYPDATPERLAQIRLTPIVVPLKDEVIGSVGTLLWVLFASMGFLLLVACANVATFILVRTEHRCREVAIRSALGAGRADIARLLLGEAIVLASAGAVLGWLIARWAVASFVAFVPFELPRLHEVRMDWTALAFTAAVTTIGAIVFTGVSLRAIGVSTLAGVSRTATTGRGPKLVRDGLVAAQIALAPTLMAGSVLMVQSFLRLTRLELGFLPYNILTVEVGVPYTKARRHSTIYNQLLLKIRTLPGVRSASAASFVPLAGAADVFPFRSAESGERTPNGTKSIPLKFITAGYFETMRMRILEGKTYGLDKVIDVSQPVWVSVSLARRLFPNQNAVGKKLQRLEAGGQDVTVLDRPTSLPYVAPPFTIAGVVADVAEESLRSGPAEIVYVPEAEPPVERSITPTNMTLAIRTDVPPLSLADEARRAIRDFDPTLSVASVRTMSAIVDLSTARERFLAFVLLFSAAASLFLGAIGVYGIVTHAVRRRTREIGIRMALGARAGHVVGLVLGEAMVVVLIGSAFGLAVAFLATQALHSFLFTVGPTDPLTLAVTITFLVIIAVMATFLPLRRAVRIDPAATLRSD